MRFIEQSDRFAAWDAARQMADAAGKPLLNIGCPAIRPLAYPCGDVCLDINRERLAHCRSPQPTHGDVRDIPYPDDSFGAVLCSHVLEHLHSPEDAAQAVTEMQRVGTAVFVCGPSQLSLVAWFHPEHRLWVDRTAEGGLAVTQR